MNSETVQQKQLSCGICNASPGKYVCPRCNLMYCSVSCYQAQLHSQCSESFYRENVLQVLKIQDRNPEDSKKILEILEKNYLQEQEDHEDPDSDDDEDADIAERLNGINLDDADAVWECLTPAEQQAFEETLRAGDVTSLIPKWEPWWMYRKEKCLVEELADTSKEEEYDYRASCPIVKDVPCLSQISKHAPAPCVTYSVINILTAYCYMMRYFNGESHEHCTEAVNVVVTLSGNLRLNHNYNSYTVAVEAVAQEAINCPWLDGSEDTLDLIRIDVQQLLAGPEESNPSYYMQAALSDIHQLVREAMRKKPTDSVQKESKFCKRFGEAFPSKGSSVAPATLRPILKKLEYFMSWAKSYSNVSS